LVIHVTYPTPNQNWVAQVYLDVLHRGVDPDGLAAWGGLLDLGLANRFQVALAIETSPEARTVQVDTLYRQLLGRPADPLGPWVPRAEHCPDGGRTRGWRP